MIILKFRLTFLLGLISTVVLGQTTLPGSNTTQQSTKPIIREAYVSIRSDVGAEIFINFESQGFLSAGEGRKFTCRIGDNYIEVKNRKTGFKQSYSAKLSANQNKFIDAEIGSIEEAHNIEKRAESEANKLKEKELDLEQQRMQNKLQIEKERIAAEKERERLADSERLKQEQQRKAREERERKLREKKERKNSLINNYNKAVNNGYGLSQYLSALRRDFPESVHNCSYCGNGIRTYNQTCGNCSGNGCVPCYACGGYGQIRCSTCNGAGKWQHTNGYYYNCNNCAGYGALRCNKCSCMRASEKGKTRAGNFLRELGKAASGEDAGFRTCTSCDGGGAQTVEQKCNECSGQGVVVY